MHVPHGPCDHDESCLVARVEYVDESAYADGKVDDGCYH